MFNSLKAGILKWLTNDMVKVDLDNNTCTVGRDTNRQPVPYGVVSGSLGTISLNTINTAKAYSMPSLSSSSPYDTPRAINLTITCAQGGFVVETSRYIENQGQTRTGLHLISDSERESLGERLANIVTLEAMAR